VTDDIIDRVLALEQLRAPFDEDALAMVAAGLASGVPALVIRAIDCVERGCLDELIPTLLKTALGADGPVADAAFQALGRHPVFALEPRPIFGPEDRERARFRFPLEHHFTDQAIMNLGRSLAEGLEQTRSLPPDERRALLCRIASLPGLGNLYPSALAGLDGDESRVLEAERTRLATRRFPRQITLNLTYRCDLGCPYCFATGMREKIPHDMPLDLARRYVDMAADSGCEMVGLLGGEPLVVPDLPELVSYVHQRGMQVAFSTNLLNYAALADRLPPEAIRAITVHVEKPDFYAPEQWQSLQENLRILADQRILTILRYNFTDPALRRWDFLSDMAALFHEPALSFSYTFPPESGQGTYTPLDRILTLKDKLMAFVDWFDESGMPLILAKPFPLCAFDREEFRRLNNRVALKSICEIARNDGTNNILIRNDGRYQLCMAVPEPVRPVDPETDSLETLAAKGARDIADLVRTPVLDVCADCMLFLRGVCQGVCYAYLGSEGGTG